MKKFLLLIFTFIMLITGGSSAFAENFYIDDYKTGINVLDNGDMEIQEVIDVVFTNPCHGIYRRIPVSYSLNYPDGRRFTVRSSVQNVSVNERYSITGDSNNFIIKIGNPDKLVSGKKRYVINYKYVLFDKNTQNGKDEFYFNVIGTGWDVPINKAAFKVTMPKEFDSKQAGVSIGEYGNAGFDEQARFYSDNKLLWGHIDRILNPHEGVTVRIPLSENYYSKDKSKNSNRTNVLILIGIFTLISFVIWFIYGKDEQIIPVIGFNPPNGENSANIGAEYRGNADIKDIISLIPYLASKGYIKIEDYTENFTVTKLRSYDGNNRTEKKLMKALFSSSYGKSVTKSELKKSPSFYKNCEELVTDLNKQTKLTIFDKRACTPGKVIIMLVCITAIIALTLYSLAYYSVETLLQAVKSENLVFMVFIIIALAVLITTYKTSRDIATKIFITFWASGFGGGPAVMFFTENRNLFLTPDPQVIIAGTAGLIISVICLINLPKRNGYGRDLTGQIEGFKRFLETAEKERIKELIWENPEYGYEMLPYAYVLGVEKTWINKMEDIMISYPEYGTRRMYNFGSFNNFMNDMYSVSIPSYSNGGISHSSGGGGGFSGGGHCGGGGGSW